MIYSLALFDMLESQFEISSDTHLALGAGNAAIITKNARQQAQIYNRFTRAEAVYAG